VKKALIIIALVTLSAVILFQSGMLDSLALFVLAGIVPGTKYAVPSSFMLLLMTSAAWIVVLNLVPFDTFYKTSPKKKPAKTAKRLPRRRYSQL
jgi:hypothetical protein